MEEISKDYNDMSSQEIDDEVLKEENNLEIQFDNLHIVQNEITALEQKELEAKEVIRRTKKLISNLGNIYKWRALKKEKGF